MEKVILITSRKIGKANISLFKEIEYGSILIDKGIIEAWLCHMDYGTKSLLFGIEDALEG